MCTLALPLPAAASAGPALVGAPSFAAADAGRPDLDRDRLFVHLLCAYRGHGGLARRDEVLRRGHPVREPWSAPAIQFDWSGVGWLPLFQFDGSGSALREDCRAVLAELAALSGWRAALWFVEPNAWLDDHRPLDLIDTDAGRVHQAARADRYVALG